MKRIILLVFIAFGIIVEANSQTYPIPAPGAQWGEYTFILFGEDF